MRKLYPRGFDFDALSWQANRTNINIYDNEDLFPDLANEGPENIRQRAVRYVHRFILP